MTRRGQSLVAVLLVLAGCAAPPKAKITPPAAPAGEAFPSTYQVPTSRPVLLRNATVLDGKGGHSSGMDVLLREGKVAALGVGLIAPADAQVVDATGRWVTPGIIDAHSHLGVYSAPSVAAHSDGNESSGPVRSEVHAEHGLWPHDPQFGRALAGGVTTAHILPGSANLFGGRGVSVKLVPANTMQGMKFPGAPYSLKMACGENPKRVYGGRSTMPASRMGNVALQRQTWAKAVEYKRKWDAYKAGKGAEPPVRDLQLETLAGVLAGEILVQNHCYRGDEMAVVLDMAKEFGYKVSAFHHATEAYKVADLLAKNGVCAALWADWWGFKMEAYDAISENIALVDAPEGGCAIVHSDDPTGIQRLNQEAAKALFAGQRLGLPLDRGKAWRWLSANPAKALGLAAVTGTLEPGKNADVVLWSADPFSVKSRALKVWIDGALAYDAADPARQKMSDFELGQPGAGDTQ